MKLKDFVLNSLRVRGRRKKPERSDTAIESDTATGCFGLDKNRHWFSSTGSKRRSCDSKLESIDFTEESWQGNDLYEGLETAKAGVVKYELRSHHTPGHKNISASGVVGFSSKPADVCVSQTTISNNIDRASSKLLVASVKDKQPYTSPQHYCHDYYCQDNHLINSQTQIKERAVLIHKRHELKHGTNSIKHSSSHTAHGAAKQDISFFRKSINSFKGMRKQSSKTKNIYSTQSGMGHIKCSLCSPSETNRASIEDVSTDKRHARSKVKGRNFFSKNKENKEWRYSRENYANLWVLDNEPQRAPDGIKERLGTIVSTPVPCERSNVRECSVQSYSSSKYDFREDSSVRDLDFIGFESASLASCESDLSRGKFHRPRSRIKTNPWLPSPRTSLSMDSQREECDLRESKENIMLTVEQDFWLTGDVSFERRRNVARPFQTCPSSDSYSNTWRKSRHRSLPPSNFMPELNLTESNSFPVFSTKRSTERVANDFASSPAVKHAEPILNDLNMNAPKSRPRSIVSPNSEFVTLADHLEQLTNNISFEYEDVLDTTMENLENCQMLVQDTLNKKNGNLPKQKLRSQRRIHISHSPDSGIGGISCSDRDLVLTTNVGRELKLSSVEPLSSSKSLDTFGNDFEINPDEGYNVDFNKSLQEPQINNDCSLLKRLNYHSFDIQNTSTVVSEPSRQNTQMIASQHGSNLNTHHVLGDIYSVALYQSDADNISTQNSAATVLSKLGTDNISSQNSAATVLSQLDTDNISTQNSAATVLSRLDTDNISTQNSATTVLSQLDTDNISTQNITVTVLSQLDTDNISTQNSAATVLSQLDTDNIVSKNSAVRELDKYNKKDQFNTDTFLDELQDYPSDHNNTIVASAADGAQKAGFYNENRSTLKVSAGGNGIQTLMTEDRCNKKRQPSSHYFLRSADVTRSDDESLEDIAPVEKSTNQIPQSSSVSTPGFACGISRPGALTIKPSISEGSRMLNNMEKNSVPVKTQRSWKDAFNIPRNITMNECLESPTENWQLDGQFSLYSFQAKENCIQMVSSDKEQPIESTPECVNQCIQLEELVVKFEDMQGSLTRQTTRNESRLGNSWLTNCDFEKLENGSRDTSFDMSDACVQTDFDDEFDHGWDDMDFLEDFEDNVLDISNSSRLLLMVGNEHGSSEHMNAPLARSSWTMMGEEMLSLSRETEDRVLSDRSSYDGPFHESKHSNLKTHNLRCVDIRSNDAIFVDSHNSIVSDQAEAMGSNYDNSRQDNEQLKRSSSETRWQPLDVGLEQSNAHKSAAVKTLPERTINLMFSDIEAATLPERTVKLMFSDIEAQFREIFKQLYDCCDTDLTNKMSQHRSLSTLNPLFSESSLADVIPNTEQLLPEDMDFEAADIKELRDRDTNGNFMQGQSKPERHC